MKSELDLKTKVTDEAIQSVEYKTNALYENWTSDCMSYLKIWLERKREHFQAEDFRQHVRYLLPPPSHERVYGAIMRRALKAGWIQYVTTAPVKSAKNHQARASVWKSLLVNAA